MNTQVEGLHKVECVGGARSSHAHSRYAILPIPPRVQQPEGSLKPLLLRFYGGFHKFLGHDPSLTPLPAPLPSLDNMEGAENLKIFIMARSFWRSLPCRNHARTHPESPQENKRCSSLL